MPFLFSWIGKGAIFIGGLFGLGWAGESIASRIGRIVSYIFIVFSGLVAIAPNKALSYIKIVPKSAYGKAKWVILICGGLVAIYQFFPSWLEKLGLIETKSWWQFWK